MLSREHSGTLIGIDAQPIEVEIDVYHGLPSIAVVGLPDNAVKESTARVKSAILDSGYPFPARRITVNLAPEDLKKEGSGFDLPIAIGRLTALGLVPSDNTKNYILKRTSLWMGESSPCAGRFHSRWQRGRLDSND